MVLAYSVAAVRAAEEQRFAEVPEGALMQAAAAGLAAVCARELRERDRGLVTGSRVVLLVGSGNNGGDALYAGARLARRGARVDAVLCGATPHPGGLAELRASGGRVHDVAGLAPDAALAAVDAVLPIADVVVDGLVGIGGSPGLREPAASVVAAVPDTATVIACDLPSGVDPDTGECPASHVEADVTVTFGLLKPCLLLPPASRAAGRVELVDLGLQPGEEDPAVERFGPAEARALWPVPKVGDDKYRRGVLGVVAGSDTYPGAAVLAVGGALRAGVGMMRYLGPSGATDVVRSRWPEVVAGRGRVQAWLLGSGVDPEADDGQRAAIEAALASGEPCVVDAGALLLVDAAPDGNSGPTPRPWLLTPHAGELATLIRRLTDEDVERADVEARPAQFARLAARLTGAAVLLKGSTTVVAHGVRLGSVVGAPAWLATAGAGDVLAGVCGALLAGGLEPFEAGNLGALMHGLAAAYASDGGPITAEDVIASLPGTVASLLQ